MDGPHIEPRTTLWAVAEVWWDDPAGQPIRAPATLEDTSPSGACLRVKTPISIGARIMVKWHRENFSAVARNCRRDGRDFILGVRREGAAALALPLDANPPHQTAPAFARTTPKDAPPAPAQFESAQLESAQPRSAAPSAKIEAATAAAAPAPTVPARTADPQFDSRAVASRTFDSPHSSGEQCATLPRTAQRISNSSLAPSSRKEGYATKKSLFQLLAPPARWCQSTRKSYPDGDSSE